MENKKFICNLLWNHISVHPHGHCSVCCGANWGADETFAKTDGKMLNIEQGVEKIIELNLAASKAALNESAQHAHALLSVKDAQELVALQTAAVQPLAEKAAAYNRQLFDIAQSTGGQIGQVVEGQVGQAQAAVEALVKNLTQNAPAGTEAASQALKAAVAAGNTALSSVQKAVHQANEMMQANVSQMAQAVPAAAKARPAAKKR